MDEEVECPSCLGTSRRPVGDVVECMCCHGKRTITKEKADCLAKIRRDLAERLKKEYGEEYYRELLRLP